MTEIQKYPKISVVIPAYNAERWLKQTLDSVLAQTFQNFEIIFVDDGSVDKTREIVNSYDRILYIPQERGGTSVARNKGISAARGDYIAFLDADDLWEPQKLQTQVQLFSLFPYLTWAYTDAWVIDGQTEIKLYRVGQRTKMFVGDILRQLLLKDFIPFSTLIVKRNVFKDVGFFNTNFVVCEDWDLELRIAAKYAVGFVNQALTRYRLHSTSKSEITNFEFRLNELISIVKSAIDREPERLLNLKNRAMSNVLINTSQRIIKNDDSRKARKLVTKAFLLYPGNITTIGYYLMTFIPRSIISKLLFFRRWVYQRILA